MVFKKTLNARRGSVHIVLAWLVTAIILNKPGECPAASAVPLPRIFLPRSIRNSLVKALT